MKCIDPCSDWRDDFQLLQLIQESSEGLFRRCLRMLFKKIPQVRFLDRLEAGKGVS